MGRNQLPFAASKVGRMNITLPAHTINIKCTFSLSMHRFTLICGHYSSASLFDSIVVMTKQSERIILPDLVTD